MEKSYLRRPLAALLSLLMVIGMFTVCGFGVLADGETVGVTLKTWSVDELDAAAQATGTKNYLDGPIYHKTDYIIGAQRVDTSADGNWLFHSQGVTNNDNNKDGTPDYFKAGDTLRVIAYLNGDLGSAGAWGRIEVAYNNDANLTTGVEFTPDVIANMGDAVIMGVPVKVFTMDIELDDEGYSAIGQLMQSRIWVNGGATLACYGVEYINVTTNSVLWGLELNHSKDGSDENSTFITVPALATYSSRPEVIGNKPEADRVYTSQDFEGECNGDNNNNVNAVLFKGLNQTLQAGQYTVNLDFATRYGLGEKKFTFNVYAGDEQIFTKEVQHTADIVSKLWSPDSGIGRVMSFDFEVSEENSGKDISFEIVCHNQTDFILREMSLSGQMAVGDALAQWDYKDLLNASDRSETNVATYDTSETASVGLEINGMAAGANGFWGDRNIPVGNVTFTEGHTVRFVQKVYMPAGIMGGGPLFRVYHTNMVADASSIGWDAYNAAPLQVDPTYGYTYKEVSYDVVIDATSAVSGQTVLHWIGVAGCDYNTNPFQIYEFSAYDVTDGGNTLLYTIDGATLAAVQGDANYYVSPITVTTAGHNVAVGYRAIDRIPSTPYWTRFDVETGAITDPQMMLEEGDVLEIGIRAWADNGLGDNQKFGYTVCYTHDGERGVELQETGVDMLGAEFDALPTQYDETYGYAYKFSSKTYEVTAEEAEELNANGFYALIGSYEDRDYANYPLTIYHFYLYNRTKDCYYQNYTGAELMNLGGSGSVNEVVYAFEGNMDKALDGYLNAGASAVFSGLTTTAGAVGQYAMNFNVTGEQGAEYTLTAYSVDGETVSPVGSKTFTASGSAETVQVAFNVRDSLVGKDLTFGMASSGEQLGFTGVTFEYVGELAADYTWDVADIAAASLDENMTYEFTDTVVVGAKINAAPWEIFFAGSLWTGDLAGVQAGDTLRMEVDMGTDQPVTDRDPDAPDGFLEPEERQRRVHLGGNYLYRPAVQCSGAEGRPRLWLSLPHLDCDHHPAGRQRRADEPHCHRGRL